METCLNERKAQRRLFTIEVKKLKEPISDNNDKTETKTRFQALNLRQEKINYLYSRFLEHVLEKGDELKIDDELTKCVENP
ncbi:unnamed protein product, partial [Larinioides sclopetarius]